MATKVTSITAPPFTTTISHVDHGQTTTDENLLPTFWFRSRNDCDFEVTQPDDIDFLYHEMFLDRLDKIQDWYYLCELPNNLGPPLPLYLTRLFGGRVLNLQRTEDLNLHLLYNLNTLFLKPIPLWLLDAEFWTSYLIPEKKDPIVEDRRKAVVASAFGFLFSYCTLLCYPSDFRIAKENGLLPESITWELWRQFAGEVLRSYRKENVHYRFWFGRLRLAKVQSIYGWRTRSLMVPYSNEANDQWLSLSFHDNFATLAAILAYVVIALTALQLGLATDKLQESPAFQSASWGFTVFSLLAPLISIFFISVVPVIVTVTVAINVRIFRSRRMQRLGFI